MRFKKQISVIMLYLLDIPRADNNPLSARHNTICSCLIKPDTRGSETNRNRKNQYSAADQIDNQQR